MKILTTSDKNRELLSRKEEASRIKVEILDTITNLTTECVSLKEAGKFLGVTPGRVRVALKVFKSTGVFGRIKGRYYVLTEKSNTLNNFQKADLTMGKESQQVKIFDTKTNITTSYASQSEAGRALGVHRMTVCGKITPRYRCFPSY